MANAKELHAELRPLSTIKPYPQNAKVHNPDQVAKLAKAIGEYGWDQPIVVDAEGVIIKGHGRRLAAIELGLEAVPVLVRDDLTAEQVKAARLSDNRIAMGDVDEDLLRKELAELSSMDIDLSLTGYDEAELDFLSSDTDELLDDLLGDEGASESASGSDSSAGTSDAPGERELPQGEEYREAFQVIVEVANEEEQEKVYTQLAEQGYKCRVLSI